MNRPIENKDTNLPRETTDGLSEIDPEKICSLEVIGEGGFGTVVKASHKDWGLVAVKYLKADNIAAIHSRKLREEARLQSKLTHPNIVQLIGIIWSPHNYAVVLEFMLHGALNEFFLEYHQVPWQWKVKMVHDIVLGLNYLHTRKPGIIHQDLKIQNCLVGESFNVKLSDFGLSEWLNYSRQYTDHRAKGGTVTHLPPERWRNINAKATRQFDVYSFGILLWEIISEKNPFEGKSDAVISQAVVNGQRPDLDIFGPYIPHFVINMMVRCWDPAPDTRPTFGTIKEEIETFIEKNKLEVDTAKQQLFRQVSSLQPSSSNGDSSTFCPSFEDPSLHVQFHSGDPEVFEISVDENSQPDSCRPHLPGQAIRPCCGTTDPALPIQRVHTSNMSQATNYALPIQRQQTGNPDMTVFPIQSVGTNENYARNAPSYAQRSLLERQGSSNINGAQNTNFNAPRGRVEDVYHQCPTVDLAGNRQVPDISRLDIGSNNSPQGDVFVNQPSINVNAGFRNQPSINMNAGPSMNIELDSTGNISVTNDGVRTSTKSHGSHIVISRTKSGGAGQPVREKTVVSGVGNGQAVQIGDSNVMNVHTGGGPAVRIGPSNKKSKVVIKKTITVSRAIVDHHAMDTVATHLGRHWKQLARELDFTNGQIDSFENDNSLLYEQIYKMLHSWVQKTGPSASYKVLAEALCKIKKGNVANRLQVTTQDT